MPASRPHAVINTSTAVATAEPLAPRTSARQSAPNGENTRPPILGHAVGPITTQAMRISRVELEW
jgi:hypothetical protein